MPSRRPKYEQLWAVMTRVVTLQMAREVTYLAVSQSVADMDDVIRLSIGKVPIDVIVGDRRIHDAALRSICKDMVHRKDLAGLIKRLLLRGGDTLIEPATESILRAAVVLVLWPYLEVGYADLDQRTDLWVVVKDGGIPPGLLQGLLFTTLD